VEKDLAHNVLVVSQGEDSPRLFTRYAKASGITWIADAAPVEEGTPFRCTAKYRYRQPDQSVTAVVKGDTLLLAADDAQRAVTPGQSVVLYLGDVCLGGATVDETGKEPFEG